MLDLAVGLRRRPQQTPEIASAIRQRVQSDTPPPAELRQRPVHPVMPIQRRFTARPRSANPSWSSTISLMLVAALSSTSAPHENPDHPPLVFPPLTSPGAHRTRRSLVPRLPSPHPRYGIHRKNFRKHWKSVFVVGVEHRRDPLGH